MEYKHKKTGIVLKKGEAIHHSYASCYFNASWTVPIDIVENSAEWEKVEEEPLLITEDKVEIFDKQQELYAVNINNWLISSTKVGGWVDPTGGREYGWRFFSTKEKRLGYIANERRLFTIEEVVSLRYHTQGEILDKAKKKLKANDSNL